MSHKKRVNFRMQGAPTIQTAAKSNNAVVKLLSRFGTVEALTPLIACVMCDAREPFDPTDEQSIWDAANRGWTRKPEGHYCPKCSEGMWSI